MVTFCLEQRILGRSQHVAYQLLASRLGTAHSATHGPHGLMEPVVGELQGLNTGSSNLLGLPETCPFDSDDELLGIGGIKPKSSPIPRRRSSLSCSDEDSQPPPSSSRRVSFADAFGLSLVSVKQFKTWSTCDPADPSEVDLTEAKEFFLKLHFALPRTLEELLCRVQDQKVELENVELLPGTTTLKGTVRVLNLCFDKLVYIRTSLDCWSSHFDLLAEYVNDSSNGVMDCFSFKLTLVPPFGDQGARVDFCIRYDTPFGTFWDNNSGQNYVLFCHEKAKEQDENDNLKPKSCLKPSRHSSMTSTTSNEEEIPEIILNCGIAAVAEPAGVKEEKLQEEHARLKDENGRNCSRRSRRKAARMAKLQQYFAQRDEKDLLQTDRDTADVDVLVPAIDEAPLNLSTQQTNVASLLAESRRPEGQKSIAGSTDADRNQVPATQTRTEERDIIPQMHPELITSKSQTGQLPLDSVKSHKSVVDSQLLESRQDKETVTSQTVGKTVERAWECFEKCAMDRMGSIADTYSSVGKTNHADSTLLENSQGSRSFGHHYTFETIVAPLYHQVFERMGNDRRGVKNSTPRADKSAGKLDGGSLRVVTYPSVMTRSNPEISAEHVNDDDPHGACAETFPEHLENTTSTTETPLSVPNATRKHVADVAFQDTDLPAITDSPVDPNTSESKTAQAATCIPLEKQHSSNSLPSVFWEESANDQRQQTPQVVILQSESLNDTEYRLDNKPPCSGYSLNTSRQDLICIDSPILPPHSEADTTAAKPCSGIVPENPQSEGSSVGQTSFEPGVSDEINKMQEKEAQPSERTLITGVRCLEESYTLMLDSTLFHSDASSDVAPNSEASGSSQDPTQVTIQPQILATGFFTQILEATGATVPQLQTTGETNLIQEATDTCQNSDAGSEMQSNPSNRNVGVDNWGKTEYHAEPIQADILHMSHEGTAVDRISQNFIDVRQIDENKEHRISHLDLPDEVTDLDELLVKGMAMSNISRNHENPENASQEEKEDVQLKNPGKNKERELTDMAETRSEEVQEIKEVERRLEEKEEEDDKQDQVEKEEQGGKVELANGGKSEDPTYCAEDNGEEVKDDKEVKAEPRRNGVECEEENEIEAELEEQEMASGVISVATLQSITNIDAFIREARLHVEEEQQNTSSEQMSVEPASERHFIGEEKEIFCGTDSSQQARTLKSNVASSGRGQEVENNSDSVEEVVCHQANKEHAAEDGVGVGKDDSFLEKQIRERLNEQSENMDDSASTESLTDDEMEVYLLRLKNTQQSGLKDGTALVKRHSISRTWTIPSPMPSISEYMDEDQPNTLPDDLTNEQMVELERATLPLSDGQEEATEANLLWWREFFSSDNMPKMIAYTLLFVVFLITTYICDFVACFGLYLLALYCLYFQVQREHLKGT